MNQEGDASSIFSDVGDKMIADHQESGSSHEGAEADPSRQARGDRAQAIAELDKMDKFKLDGQEWTLKDLKSAIMRNKDYTQKTQRLAEDRRAFDEDRRFSDNLYADLFKLAKDPNLVSEFIKIYPAKYHSIAAEFLKMNAPKQDGQPSVQNNQPSVDVNLLSKINRFEQFMQEQEVSRHETDIQRITDDLFKKYPEASQKIAKEAVFARAFESHSLGTKLDQEAWEQIVKDVADEVKALAKADYAQKVKKQTEANTKSKDVAPGGGIPGRAPEKFKSWKELNEYAFKGMTGNS